MQQSSISYRSSNRHSAQSRRIHSQIPPPPPPPPALSYPTILQQQQIQQLEHKVDMILLHNGQLLEENGELKRRLEMVSLREVDARYSLGDGMEEVYRLTRELELKTLEIQSLKRDSVEEKQDLRLKFDEVSIILNELRSSHQKILMQKQQIEKKLFKVTQQRQRQINRIRQQYENEVYENSLKKQIEHKDELRERQHQFNRAIQKNNKQWQEEKIQMEEQKMNTIIGLQQKMEKQKEELRKKIEQQFGEVIKRINNEADQKCRKVRQQTQIYLKSMLQQNKDEDKQEQQLKKQIESLKQSLDERQKVITNLLKAQSKNGNIGSTSYFNQVQQLRQKIKEVTQHFFKQSELLKVKMAVKHDIDIREMVRVYDNKIDTLTAHIAFLENDKKTLREKYEDQIRSKMKQRQKFEIEVSKLKNYIRKMKIQLQSYGKEMRLNIEGIRDQANSFSMSILGQLGQEKNKKNFYEEQIRKMREVVDLKDHQMEILMKQCQQKLKYYDQRVKGAKESIQTLSEQLQGKDERFREEFDQFKENAKEEMKREKQFWEEKLNQLKKEIIDLRKLNEKLQQALKQSQSTKGGLQKDLQKVTHELESHKAHIDTLKMQLQMAGQNVNDDQAKNLKQHYERIIQQLQHDKQILKETNIGQGQQMAKLVAKYKILEKSMEKTLSTMKKKTILEERVMELGMDNNLVKNLEEVFRKSQQEKQNSRQK